MFLKTLCAFEQTKFGSISVSLCVADYLRLSAALSLRRGLACVKKDNAILSGYFRVFHFRYSVNHIGDKNRQVLPLNK